MNRHDVGQLKAGREWKMRVDLGKQDLPLILCCGRKHRYCEGSCGADSTMGDKSEGIQRLAVGVLLENQFCPC